MAQENNKIQELEKLIKESGVFDNGTKEEMIKHIKEVSDADILKAIEAFEWEKEEWEKINKKSNKQIKKMEEFAVKSKKDLEHTAQKIINEKEGSEKEEEIEEAENILNTI